MEHFSFARIIKQNKQKQKKPKQIRIRNLCNERKLMQIDAQNKCILTLKEQKRQKEKTTA